MAKTGQSGLEAIAATLPHGQREGLPPVHLWNPRFAAISTCESPATVSGSIKRPRLGGLRW